MNNGFDAEKDLSQVNPQTSEPELTPRQNKIYRNSERYRTRNRCLLSGRGKDATLR